MSSATRAEITWRAGGTATIDVLDEDRIELVSTRAFAPGSRPEGTLAPGGQPIWLKVHGSRRHDDGTYRVKGRLLNVRREMLDLLKGLVHRPNDGRSSTS